MGVLLASRGVWIEKNFVVEFVISRDNSGVDLRDVNNYVLDAVKFISTVGIFDFCSIKFFYLNGNFYCF